MLQELTPAQIEAARLVADDELTDEQIAAKVGTNRMQLHRWKQTEAFAALVNEHREAYRRAVLSSGIADVTNRVKALQDRWKRMERVIDARGRRYTNHRKDTLFQDAEEIPEEAETGLVILEVTYTKAGRVEKWGVDTPLLSEMRATEKQAAQEVGQWVERHQHGFADLPDADLIQRAKSLFAGTFAARSDPDAPAAEAEMVQPALPDD